MAELSTHNDNSLSKEQAQARRQARVVSTRNLIPFGRSVTRDDVNAFVEKRKESLAKEEPAKQEVKGEVQAPGVEDAKTEQSKEEPKELSDEYKKLYGMEDKKETPKKDTKK